MYVDMRDADENDTMDTWNDEKLAEVVDKKHGDEKRKPTTDIVSQSICIIFIFLIDHVIFILLRSANFSWKLSRNQSTDGSGNVQMANDASIGMHCRKAMF